MVDAQTIGVLVTATSVTVAAIYYVINLRMRARPAGTRPIRCEGAIRAGTHPARVNHIVYLDAAYDWGYPASAEAFKSLPSETTPMDNDMKSLDAYREYMRTMWFPGVSDTSRWEAYLRDKVVIQADGSVRLAMIPSASQALFTTLRARDAREARAQLF